MNHIKIIFWNVNGKDLRCYINEIINQEDPDIFILAEGELVDLSKITGQSFKELDSVSIKIPPRKIIKLRTFYNTRINVFDIEDLSDMRASAKGIKIRISGKEEEILLLPIHFPSKMYDEDGEKKRFLLGKIDEKITNIFNSRTSNLTKMDKAIMIGDFNANPYEACLSKNLQVRISNCPAKNATSKGQRIYYNPSLHLLSNFNQTSLGSFYKDEWHLLDQTIFTRSLLPYFNRPELQLIDCHTKTLLGKNKKPNNSISDHLPIKIKFNI